MKKNSGCLANSDTGADKLCGSGSQAREDIASLQEKIRQLELVVEQQVENHTLIARHLKEEIAAKDRVIEQLRSRQHVADTEADGQAQDEEITCLQDQVRVLQASLSAAEERATQAAENGQQGEVKPGQADNAGADASNAVFRQRLQKLHMLDLLTGTANRQHFMQILEQASSAPVDGEEQALLYILLDNFRAVRENLGVTESDRLLRDVADLIKDNVGAQDSVARFGDCVFTIIYRGDDILTTRDFAEGIQHHLEEHVFDMGGNSVRLAASIGVCEIGNYHLSAEELIERADLACEVARSLDDEKIHFHNVVAEEQLCLEHESGSQDMVRKTIQEARFYLVYQPIVSLGGDKRERYEVLLRVLDEAGEVALPGQFLAAAGSLGLAGEVDRWVVESALRQLSELQDSGKDVTFHIKISADTIADCELVFWIDARLAEHQLQRENVVFEIAEMAVMDNMEVAIAFVTAMHNLGCKVALEHYAGFSQPQLLKSLPVDILKVNGSLVEGLIANRENQIRVKAIIELASDLNMQCVIERVEETSALALLWQFGVQFVQGNFVQLPGKELDYNFDGDITVEESTVFAMDIG